MKTLIAMAFAVIVAAPGIADQIRHPGKQLAAGNCQTICTYNPVTRGQICNTHCY